jgi:hypothetical protein
MSVDVRTITSVKFVVAVRPPAVPEKHLPVPSLATAERGTIRN